LRPVNFQQWGGLKYKREIKADKHLDRSKKKGAGGQRNDPFVVPGIGGGGEVKNWRGTSQKQNKLSRKPKKNGEGGFLGTPSEMMGPGASVSPGLGLSVGSRANGKTKSPS